MRIFEVHTLDHPGSPQAKPPSVAEYEKASQMARPPLYWIELAAAENTVCIGANQSDGPHDKHEDHGKHNRVFRDILAIILPTRFAEKADHASPPAIYVANEAVRQGGSSGVIGNIWFNVR